MSEAEAGKVLLHLDDDLKLLTLTLTLFRKKRFEINFFVQRNASKFAILYVLCSTNGIIRRRKIKVTKNFKKCNTCGKTFLATYATAMYA